jgi:hypothetical protein
MNYLPSTFSRAFRLRTWNEFRHVQDTALAAQAGAYDVGHPGLNYRNPSVVRPHWTIKYAALGAHNVRKRHRPLLLQLYFRQPDLARVLRCKARK